VTPLILDMLAADPHSRPSMRAVADTIAALRQTPPPSNGAVPDPSATEASVATSVSDPLPAPDAAASPVPRPTAPRRNRGIAAALAVVLLGVGILLATLLLDDRRSANPTADTGESTSAPPATTGRPTPTPPASTKTAEPSSTATQTPAPTATPSTKPRTRSPAPTTAPTVRGAATEAELRQAITSYYALLPRNTDAAWPGMTASYQANHAGGRQAYERFWGAISKIKVTKVTGSRPRSAQATLTYYFKDGRVIRERTAYGLINDGGRLKINTSTVLSSTQV
jgi:hypothetical protein